MSPNLSYFEFLRGDWGESAAAEPLNWFFGISMGFAFARLMLSASSGVRTEESLRVRLDFACFKFEAGSPLFIEAERFFK